MGSAAAVIIGNEILSGRIRDENSAWLATRCRALGIDLRRIVVIPDDIDDIAATVAQLGPTVDHLFTSGGVGPTHDDVTMQGVAQAFRVPLVRHPQVEAALLDKLGERATDAALSMADIPQGAQLWWEGEIFFPLIVMANVCIFPGVPDLFRRRFDAVAHRLQSDQRVFSRSVCVVAREIAIASVLSGFQRRHPTIRVGSYPQFDRKPWTVEITLEGRDAPALDTAQVDLQNLLAPFIQPDQP